ncbi:MAG: NUDIX hydrolase [Chloroflexi bacterium]|nr:NUDIX hydrolase [Chloroflexota bacterium]
MQNDDALIEVEIAAEDIYKGRLLHLQRKQVRLPNGETAQREIILHPGAVAMVPRTADGHILLVRQFRKAAERILLEVPAGTLTPGEDVWKAAERELREEIGYRPDKLTKLGGIFVAPGYSTEYIHLFLAEGLIHDPLSLDHDEFIEPIIVTFAEALAKIASGEIEDAKSISSLLLTQQYLAKS